MGLDVQIISPKAAKKNTKKILRKLRNLERRGASCNRVYNKYFRENEAPTIVYCYEELEKFIDELLTGNKIIETEYSALLKSLNNLCISLEECSKTGKKLRKGTVASLIKKHEKVFQNTTLTKLNLNQVENPNHWQNVILSVLFLWNNKV